MAIKQFTGNIGDLVEFHMRATRTLSETETHELTWSVVGYVWKSEPKKVVLSNRGVISRAGSVRDRSIFGDRIVGEETYSVKLESVNRYEILKPYVAE